MEGYICRVCKSKHGTDETFHSVLCSDGLYVATCSVECFNIEKNRQINRVKEILKEIEEQLPHIEVW